MLGHQRNALGARTLDDAFYEQVEDDDQDKVERAAGTGRLPGAKAATSSNMTSSTTRRRERRERFHDGRKPLETQPLHYDPVSHGVDAQKVAFEHILEQHDEDGDAYAKHDHRFVLEDKTPEVPPVSTMRSLLRAFLFTESLPAISMVGKGSGTATPRRRPCAIII